MDRAQKAELVSALHDTFAEIGVVVVTRNLGLTVAQKIFQDHGGDVVLESTQFGRTVFKLILPLTAPSAP